MFDPTKEVPSLELCKKLKELEFPQDGGGWYWRKIEGSWKLEFQNKFLSVIRRLTIQNVLVKAPTVVEMLEYIPQYLEVEENGYKKGGVFLIDLPDEYYNNEYTAGYWAYREVDEITESGRTLPEAVAKILIWLAENGHVNFKKEV